MLVRGILVSMDWIDVFPWYCSRELGVAAGEPGTMDVP